MRALPWCYDFEMYLILTPRFKRKKWPQHASHGVLAHHPANIFTIPPDCTTTINGTCIENTLVQITRNTFVFHSTKT